MTTANNKPNRPTLQARLAQAIAGVKKDMQNVTTLSLAGTSYTPKTLMAFLQSVIDAGNAADVARANWLAATKAAATLAKSGTETLTGLKQYAVNTYGKSSATLTDYGFAPKKTATLTVEEKSVAVTKRAATREARGTKGPKAKLKITGASAGVTQQAASPAPTAAPVPASPAPVPVATPTATPAIAPAVVSAAPPATTSTHS